MKKLENYSIANWFYLVGGLSAIILGIVAVVSGTQHIWYESPLILTGLMALMVALVGILPARQKTIAGILRIGGIFFAVILILRCIAGILFRVK